MKHQKGIDLVRPGADTGYTVNEGSRRGSSRSASTKQGGAATLPYAGGRLTLAEFNKEDSLGGRCAACRHVGWIDQSELARRFGTGVMIGVLTPRLRCASCGNKGNNSWVADRLGVA